MTLPHPIDAPLIFTFYINPLSTLKWTLFSKEWIEASLKLLEVASNVPDLRISRFYCPNIVAIIWVRYVIKLYKYALIWRTMNIEECSSFVHCVGETQIISDNHMTIFWTNIKLFWTNFGTNCHDIQPGDIMTLGCSSFRRALDCSIQHKYVNQSRSTCQTGCSIDRFVF